MRILLSAYACEPGKGSEPEVGLRTAIAAARNHRVWVMTRENNLPALHAFFSEHPLRRRVTLIGFDVPGWSQRWKKHSDVAANAYYDQWQRAAGARALDLDGDVGFDVVHHVTFAAYWKRAGIAIVRKPFVWGPIGGGVQAPWQLALHLGVRGFFEEAGRTVVRPVVARMPGIRLAQRRAAVALVQNADTGQRIATGRSPIVLPNALGAVVPPTALGTDRRREVVVVSNLVPWKAVDLALAAFARIRSADVRLQVLGEGSQGARLRSMARTLGLDGRVSFLGQRPREEVLCIIGQASVLLHTALHEEAGWAVAEALALGTPVACLDRGGPPELLRQWPQTPSHAVRPASRHQTAEELAETIDRLLPQARVTTAVHHPTLAFDDAILRAYEDAVRHTVVTS